MSDTTPYFDELLSGWPFRANDVVVREGQGADGRPLLLLRIEMGAILMEVTGRPDGDRPEGFETYYDAVVAESLDEGAAFQLTPDRRREIDREFYQYYHRRIAFLALRRYAEAQQDAEHTLRLMDFSTEHAPSEDWAELHEQYRPFVLFHRVQAEALAALESGEARQAIAVIESGSEQLETLLPEKDDAQSEDEAELIHKLAEMRSAIVEHYDIGPTLAEQLAEAIAAEQYELAARLRDQINHSDGR